MLNTVNKSKTDLAGSRLAAEVVARALAEIFPRMMMKMVKLGDGLPRSVGSMTPQQLRVLTALDMAGRPLRMSELSEALGVTQGTVTDVTKRLIKLRYLLRERLKEDDRVVCLSLSVQGRAVVRELHQQRYKLFLKVCEDLDPGTRRKFLESHQVILEIYSTVLSSR